MNRDPAVGRLLHVRWKTSGFATRNWKLETALSRRTRLRRAHALRAPNVRHLAALRKLQHCPHLRQRRPHSLFTRSNQLWRPLEAVVGESVHVRLNHQVRVFLPRIDQFRLRDREALSDDLK